MSSFRQITIAFLFVLSLSKLSLADQFKIGVTLPLTGALAEYGAAVENGIKLAREENPELLKNITVLFEDDGYEPRRAITAAQKLLEIDKISLIYTWGTETALAVAPVTESKKFPTIAGSIDPRPSLKREWVVGFYRPYKDYSEKLVQVFKEQGVNNIEIVKAELSFFNGLVDGIETAKTKELSVNINGPYTPSELDFRSVILKLKNKKFDRIGLYLTNPQILSFLKQSAELKLETKYFGASQFYDRKLVADFGKSLVGALLTHNRCDPNFHKRYFDRFGIDTHISYAANAYEFARLTGELFGDGIKRTSSEIRDKILKQTVARQSVAGEYSLVAHSEGGYYFNFPSAVYEIGEKGEYRVVR